MAASQRGLQRLASQPRGPKRATSYLRGARSRGHASPTTIVPARAHASRSGSRHAHAPYLSDSTIAANKAAPIMTRRAARGSDPPLTRSARSGSRKVGDGTKNRQFQLRTKNRGLGKGGPRNNPALNRGHYVEKVVTRPSEGRLTGPRDQTWSD